MCKPPVICSYSTPFKAGVGRHFDPRSPRGERLLPGVVGNSGLEISIHAPRKGSDAGPQRGARGQVWHFYPRSPQGERPGTVLVLRGRSRISIHAPREGSDLFKHHTWRPAWTFLSTLPARGATRPARSKPRSKEISIHAPREGSDRRPLRGATFSSPFLSTLPARGATRDKV